MRLFKTLGTRWRAERHEVTGSDTRTSCGMYSCKRQTRTLASSGRPYRKTNTRLASTSSLIAAKACRRSGEAKTGAHPATVGSHTVIIAPMGCRFSKQQRAPGPGRHNWFEPSTQGMHAADSRLSPRIFHAADIKPTICEPRACQQSVSQQCAWRQIPHTSILGCFGIRSAPPHTS
jgi:hypothetical protein